MLFHMKEMTTIPRARRLGKEGPLMPLSEETGALAVELGHRRQLAKCLHLGALASRKDPWVLLFCDHR